MADWQFWTLFVTLSGLIVICIFSAIRCIGDAEDLITSKIDDLKSELMDVKSKVDKL